LAIVIIVAFALVTLFVGALCAGAKKVDTVFNYDDPEALAHRPRLFRRRLRTVTTSSSADTTGLR
jgi:hypothetical protein